MSKIVLIIASTLKGNIVTLESSMKLASEIRRSGKIPLARNLDYDFSLEPNSIEETREFERDAIVRRFVDEVTFTDIEANDIQEVRALAIQYGFCAKPARAA